MPGPWKLVIADKRGGVRYSSTHASADAARRAAREWAGVWFHDRCAVTYAILAPSGVVYQRCEELQAGWRLVWASGQPAMTPPAAPEASGE